jgi:microcystin degradation protein MlrC
MRVAVAEINQETNTFSPVPTTIEDFKDYGLYLGDEILVKQRGVGAIGGFLDVAEHEGGDLEILPILRALALAGGRVTEEALCIIEKTLVEELEKVKPIDGLFLSLHGAMAADHVDDVEGYLLNSVRRVLGNDIPIVAPLDHHGNVTELMVRTADILCGHETEPHKSYETGRKAARIFFDLTKSRISPTVAWEKIPMVCHQEKFFTSIAPMKEWFDLARKMEKQPGVICISNFPMQPWLDVSEAGWSTVVYTEKDPDLARMLAVELAEKAWDLRERFWELESVSPHEAVRRAVKAKLGLILLSDTGDSVAGGAPGDNTSLLTEMLEQHITCSALVPIFDPETVEEAITAGKGTTLTLDVGGKFDKFSKPARVTGTVTGIADGRMKARIEGLGIESFDVGRSVLLEVGSIKIVVSERRGNGGIHPIIYTRFGVDIAEAKMVDLKTATYFKYYEPYVAEVIRVDTLGLSTSHLEKLSWTRIPRPMYPFDDMQIWYPRNSYHINSRL